MTDEMAISLKYLQERNAELEEETATVAESSYRRGREDERRCILASLRHNEDARREVSRIPENLDPPLRVECMRSVWTITKNV